MKKDPSASPSFSSLRYKCASCDEIHEGLPALTYRAPMYVHDIPEREQKDRVQLTADTCAIDGEHFFVRTVLLIPIQGTTESLEFGVWQSVSEKNYLSYCSLLKGKPYDDPGYVVGWISNPIPTFAEPETVMSRFQFPTDDQRPEIEIEPTDHPLSVAQREGIPLSQVEELLGISFQHADPSNN